MATEQPQELVQGEAKNPSGASKPLQLGAIEEPPAQVETTSNISVPGEDKPISQSEVQRMMDARELWHLGSNLREIHWQKRWPEYVATLLGGVFITAAGTGGAEWRSTSHAVFFGLHYGWFIIAGLALVAAGAFFATVKEQQEPPSATVKRVVARMEGLGWIDPPEPPPSPRLRRPLNQCIYDFWTGRVWGDLVKKQPAGTSDADPQPAP